MVYVINACAGYFPPQMVGGAEIHVDAFCKALIERGHQAAVLAGLRAGGWLYWKNRVLARLGVEGGTPADRVCGYPVYRTWNPAKAIAAVVAKRRPDVAIVQQGWLRLSFAQAFRQCGIPTLVQLHHENFDDFEHEPEKLIGLQFMAVSRSAANSFSRRFGIRAVLGPNVFDPSLYRTQVNGRFVTLVNPHPMKGGEVALTLAEALPDIPFLFVESWPLEPELKRRLQDRARAAGNIEWRQSTRDMRTVYTDTSLLILPSQFVEGCPRVIIEAQFNGIPVVAADVGGAGEAVGHGGIVLPQKDLDAWIRTIRRLWDHPNERAALQARALKRVQEDDVDRDAVLRGYEEIFDHAMRGKPIPDLFRLGR